MSRLIVKNLPKNMTPERLREVFSTKGQVTDCNLKYTRDGAFRQFAFIGYHSNDQCAAAIAHFHNSFIDTSKIQVAPAYDLGDTNKPRSWSKYSAESSSYVNKQKAVSHPGANTEDSTDKKEKKKKKRNKEEKMKELLGDLYDNPEFLEFLEAQKLSGKGAKTMWSNDTIECLKETFKGAEKHPGVVFDDDDDDDSGNESEDTTTTTTTPTTTANKAHHNQSASKDSDTELEDSKATTTPTVKYSVRMKGLKGRFHNDTIKEFFHPLKLKQVHIPRGLNHKQFGVVFAEFFSAEDVKLAMERQGKFICGCQITLKESTTSGSCYDNDNNNNSAGLEKTKVDNSIVPEDEEEEELSESGRLFIRNLPYTCTEEDLEKHFSKYGALTEVYLPQDPHTNKLRGFAFVTFLIPETAVKVLAEMDGTSFQGRLLHILPSRIKKDRENKEDSLANSSYKTKNLQKKKSQAQSSHNWNALFLGSNAVADVLSDKYGISKSDLLDIESSDSLGVRMALGETQIVSETREFLLENGVALDSFSQSSGPRSKTVILVKNLPAGCHGDAVAKVFSRHGTLGRVIFPPSAITAIVEFISPADAKRAFTNLAYTKFQHLPLYLEWAPQQTFVNPTPPPPSAPAQEGSKSTAESTEQAKPRDDDDEEEEEEEDSDVEPDSVMFVKNLTLDTTEDDLTQVFQSCGPIRNVMVARKKDLKNQGQVTSMGYAFVEFKKSSSADKAIKTLQRAVVDGRQVELKISNRRTLSDKVVSRQKQVEKKQKTSKILVRNIPFQANKREIQQLFSVFGELKVVRLPKKVTGTGSHRGFAFVDFVNCKDAKKAFTSLCHSTHLYGRRLVLEWAQLETDLAGALSGLEGLRKRTADHYHDDSPKKSRKSDIVASLTD